jgi:phosphoglycerate dehydrogenase-like enzyme
VIVNLSRGGVIDEAALIEALYSRRIRGAGLDVFDTEPLPADSPFWDAPNTLVSPHFSAPVHDRLKRTLAIIDENFRRYRAGEAMLNALTPEDVYTAD